MGKTTWYQTGIEQKYISPDLPFINVDSIVLKELGGYTPENIAMGEQIARDRISTLITENKDFMIESNLSKSSDYEWISAMRKKGYNTILYFLGTENVEINKARVQQRVLEGGHDISPSLIEHRYQVAHSYLKSKILEFTESIIIDVSQEFPKQMAKLKLTKIEYEHPEILPWIKDILHLAERLNQKLKIKEEETRKQSKRHKL